MTTIERHQTSGPFTLLWEGREERAGRALPSLRSTLPQEGEGKSLLIWQRLGRRGVSTASSAVPLADNCTKPQLAFLLYRN